MTYVMADIHGNMRRFKSVMAQIHLQPEDTLYVLGDLIDRHPDGIRILQKLRKMSNVRFLLGNHEYMMLNALDEPWDENDPGSVEHHLHELRLWYHNGGRVTHNYLKHIRKDVRKELFAFLRNLPLNLDVEVNGTKYKLIHGAPVEFFGDHKWEYRSLTRFAVWYRWEIEDPDMDDVVLIFGHTPTEYFADPNPLCVWFAENGKRIGIDCGSGYPDVAQEPRESQGRLACLRLDDMKVFYSEEVGPKESAWEQEI